MLSRLSPRKLSLASIMRIVVAGVLLLALLAGAVPTGALSSSAEQTCTMSCCAGKPPHMAGSCGAAFSGGQETEPGGDHSVAHHAHTGGTHKQASSPEIIEAESHCGTPAPHQSERKEHSSRSSHAPQAATVVAAHVLTTPCSPECAAAAASAFVQVRRARETAALTAGHSTLAPACGSLADGSAGLQKSSAAHGRQSRPRGPPRSPST